MKACIFHGPGNVNVDQTPEPRVAPGDILIKVDAASRLGMDGLKSLVVF